VKRERGFTLIELMVVVGIIAIVSMLMTTFASRQIGANGKNVADQINSFVSAGRQRAVATQHYQRIEITPTAINMWQFRQAGMATPSGTCPPNCWDFVRSMTMPNGVSVWSVSTTVYGQTAGAGNGPSAKNTSLDYNLDIRPDGGSTGGTVFVSDDTGTNQYRVAVYKITGGSYARAGW
jgi:prepilin-type N-terminal cleavage/methylation domain-containing protein